MEISTAQSELRRTYVHGGPGAVVSGIVWLTAGVVASRSGVGFGFGVLFFGGMLIFPISALIVSLLFGRKQPSKGNPGGTTVFETVFPMMGGLLAAWLLLPHRPDFVFPIAAIAVGAHYFGFQTAYGDKTYWILAALLCAVGTGSIFVKLPPSNNVAYVFAAIEILFGCQLTWVGVRQHRNLPSGDWDKAP